MTTRTRLVLIIGAILLLAGAALVYEIISTRPVREAVRRVQAEGLIVFGGKRSMSPPPSIRR